MTALIVVAAACVLFLAVVGFEVLWTPAGIEREHHIEQRTKIFSSTRTVTDATPDEVIRVLEGDWSWWKRAGVQPMKDLGGGRKEFLFHPVCFFGTFEGPAGFVVRFDRIESLPGGGKRIDATVTGDFDGHATYTARPGAAGTMVELAWCGVEVRNVLRFVPLTLVTLIHCWRERLGIQGLRERLASTRSQAA